jgi:hypothetical protein
MITTMRKEANGTHASLVEKQTKTIVDEQNMNRSLVPKRVDVGCTMTPPMRDGLGCSCLGNESS